MQLIRVFNNEQPITSVTLSDKGSLGVTAGLDNVVKVWDIETGNVIKRFSGHRGNITSIALSTCRTKWIGSLSIQW